MICPDCNHGRGPTGYVCATCNGCGVCGPTKALTIKQPWAALIAAHEKTIEHRTWRTHYRGPIIITASAAPKLTTDDGIVLPTGCTVCHATLADVRPFRASDLYDAVMDDMELTREEIAELCRGWAWVLEDVVALPERPVKGRVGLWNFDPEQP